MDRIKKLKIKKQDGTFSDYIPIGADAENIDTADGESVEIKLNKKPYYYNSVADMKADNKLKAGDMAITLGYYEPNDDGGAEYKIVSGTHTDDGGSYHALNNSLFAELIMKNNESNIKQWGCKGDSSFDNTTIFNKMMSSDYSSFIIPPGEFKILGDVFLKSNLVLKGTEKRSNIQIQPTGRFFYNPSQTKYLNVTFDNITFRMNGERSTYAITLNDVSLCRLNNCVFRSDSGTSSFNGVIFRRNYNNDCYDNRILNCQFQRACLVLENSTDNWVVNNILWGNDLGETGAGLILNGNCGNSLIQGNHIINGMKVITVQHNIRFVNNYFDGLGDHGIYGNGGFQISNIDNNVFFHNGDPINVSELSMTTVCNNIFDNCDSKDEGLYDVTVSGVQGGNTFSGNKHYRTDKYTRTNLTKPYNLADGNINYPKTIISNNTLAFPSFYQNQNSIDRVAFRDNYPDSYFPQS